MIQMGGDARQVAQPVAVAVGEAARIDLIDAICAMRRDTLMRPKPVRQGCRAGQIRDQKPDSLSGGVGLSLPNAAGFCKPAVRECVTGHLLLSANPP
jgi:hypothetical protein